jgi:putative copper resistance protein D
LDLVVGLSGSLSVVVHGLVLVAQAMLLGGVLFLVLLARPLGWLLGQAGLLVRQDTARIAGWAALGLVVTEGMAVAMQAAALMTTAGLPLGHVLHATFMLAGLVKIGMAFLLAAVLFGLGGRAPGWLLLPLGAADLVAAAMTPHAMAHGGQSQVLLAASAVHQVGAALWIGGIPCFVSALRRVNEAAAWEMIGSRFSGMAMLGVACIAVSGAGMAYVYVGDWPGFYGTGYGAMVGVKLAMFAALLGLGWANFLAVRRLRGPRARAWGVNRLKCFAEVQIGVGFALFFAAAALTSGPPAVDLPQNRVTQQDIVARLTPEWPRLEAAKAGPGLVAGAGGVSSANAAEVAWVEYTAHWVGLFMLAIAVLALLNQMGLRIARHWPLLLVGLAGFLFIRTDPQSWPLGSRSLMDSLREPAMIRERVFALLIVVLALLEWRVRLRGQRNGWQPLAFPLAAALGGTALLMHGQAVANVKQHVLVELTYIPLALVGMAAGWARWLELRLTPPGNRIAGWVWPACFMLAGMLLLFYREA